MDDLQVDSIQRELNLRETEDLVEIWQEHDKAKWSESAFEAIRLILLKRTGEVPLFEDKEEADKFIKLAEGFIEANQLDKAMQQSDLAIKSAPHYGDAYFCKGTILDEMGELENAIEYYKKALNFSPDLADAKRDLRWAIKELSQRATNREERILAALAHGSVLLLAIGLPIPIIIM